ncbi:hypothetical protein V8E55_005299 [Tylopilus felleus]|jgi:hypothetical protein
MSEASAIFPLSEPIYTSFFFGAILTTAFYGVTCMQTFFYFVHYPNDRLSIKILVTTIWALNTTHEALSVAGVYKYLMAGLVNPFSFVTGNPEMILIYLLTALVATPTQGFFVYRLYMFSGKNVVAPIIWAALALTSLVCATVYVCEALYNDNGVRVVELTVLNGGIFVVLGYICLSIAAGVDILVAIFMTFLLFRERVSGHARTAHILQRLTVFAVNTGIWTATFAVMTIIFLHRFPDKVYYAIFIVPLCSVYCNTLLANLNARTYLTVGGGGMTFNVDTTMSGPITIGSQVFGGSNGDKRPEQVKFVTSPHQGVWKSTEVVTFPEGNSSTSKGDSV